jgi:hypothetical protein
MNGRPERIGVVMHGVTLNLGCAHEGLRRYATALLGDHVCSPWPHPDLEVEGHWRVPSSDEEVRRPFFDVTGLDAYGKRMHIGSDELVWSDTCRDKNLQLRFRRDGARAAFDVAYHYQPSAKKLAKYTDYERKKFFDMVQYLAFFPIAWHLRRTRGWELIHASAVAVDEGAVLIAGPGGAGKSTTCLALAARPGVRLLTENLVFCDGELVYPVGEPIRLTDESLRLLGSATDQLRSCAAAGPLKQKTMFVPPAEPNPAGIRAALLFLARFSAPGFVRQLQPAIARDLLRASNHLTLELDDFHWYCAALDLLWPGEPRAGGDVLERLTASARCYSLGIDRSAGVAPVVAHVLGCLRQQASQLVDTEAP